MSRALRPAIVAIFLALSLLTACIKKHDPNTIRFRYWGDIQEINIISGLIQNFEKAHPGVKVREERKNPPSQAYLEVLMNEFAAGNAPDVIFCVAEIKDVLSESGLLDDLEPMLAVEKSFSKKDFYPSVIERFSTDGKLLVLPRDIAPFACVYYNKALFKQAKLKEPDNDWNWDLFRKDAKALAQLKTAVGDKVWGFADDWPMPEAFVLSAGGQIADDMLKPGKLLFDSPLAIQGYLFRWDLMFTDGSMPATADMQALRGGTEAMFKNGRLAMFYSGVWKSPAFREIKDFDWDFADFPKGPSGKRGYMSGGSGYSIRKGLDEKKKALAWELVRYLAGPEAQAKMAATGLTQPAIQKIAASPVFLDGQKPLNKKTLLKAAMIATHPPATGNWLKFGGEFGAPVLDQIWVRGFKREDVPAKIKEAVAGANKKYFAKP